MGDLALVFRQTYYGLKSTRRPARDRLRAAFPDHLPAAVQLNLRQAGRHGDRRRTSVPIEAYFTGGLMAYAIMLNCFSTLVISLTTQRESGQLKRYRGTPVPSWTFIASLVLRSMALAAVMVVVLLALGAAAYDVEIHGEALVGLVVYAVLGTATMCALGVAVSAFAPNADAAGAIGRFSAVILSFSASVFVPIDQLPEWLQQVGRVFPLFHLAEGLQKSRGVTSGTGLRANNVAVLALWAVGSAIVA